MIRRRRDLEAALQPLAAFAEPKIQLEQYPTSAHLASHIMFAAEDSFGDIAGRNVLDLGCGCGMLTAAAAMLDAACVVGVDIDADALAIARENLDSLGLLGQVDLVNDSVVERAGKAAPASSSSGGGSGGGRKPGRAAKDGADGAWIPNASLAAGLHGKFDTVVLNPPFGTKPGNAGIDIGFLQAACQIATAAVYSFHKSSTRQFVLKKAKEWGWSGEVIAEMKFDVPKMYRFHTKDSVDIHVDLIRLERLS